MTRISLRWAYKLYEKAPPLATSPDLPDDIIADIISRLPVKSLLRLKLVCKSWFCLISSPQFTKTHLKKACNANDYANHIVVTYSNKDYKNPWMILLPLHVISRKPSYKTSSLNMLSRESTPRFIVGSYNGLICLITNPGGIYLWNPSVRKYSGVPTDDSIKRLLNNPNSPTRYGFHYDVNGDDYKIVILGNTSKTRNVATFWSSKTNSWNNIQDRPSGCVKTPSGVAANGKLHWIVHENTYRIFALDLKSKIFLEIPMPNGDVNGCLFPVLTVFRGSLSIVCQCLCSGKMQTGLWVMKQYGDKTSWTRMFVLPRVKCPWPWYRRVPSYLEYTSPLCIMGNCELVLFHDWRFWHLVQRMSKLLFRRAQQITYEIWHGDCNLFYFQVPTFVESLISPSLGDREKAAILFE